MKNTIMNNEKLSRRNQEYDAIIRFIFSGMYPNISLRQVLDDVNTKYDNAIVTYYRLTRETKCKQTKIVQEAINEFLIESAKTLHQYCDYAIDELPALCVAPYLKKIEKEIEAREEIVSIKESMYGNKTVADLYKENEHKCERTIDTLKEQILLDSMISAIVLL